MVEWDEGRMSEVVGNLLSNAFKFTGRGGSVDLEVYNVDEGVRLEVRDTGVGIPEDQLSRVFDKFYQAVENGESSVIGTGLGLAIAREIVEAHGGTISVESRMKVGTTFRITVPVQSKGGREMLSRRLTPAVRGEVKT
jgi:signal transduction histidine kinase